MFIVDEVTGNIILTQGDSGTLPLTNIPTDEDYTIYFAIYDENRRKIGNEIATYVNRIDTVEIKITSSLTDFLTVDNDEETHEYYYGVKLCNESGYEDTLLIGDNPQIGDLNTITVYPKKCEGTISSSDVEMMRY